MADTKSVLEALYEKRRVLEKRIQAEKRRILEKRIKGLQADLDAIERSIKLFSAHQEPNTSVEPTEGKYAGLGVKAAVESFLQANAGTFFGTRQVAEELERGGIESLSKTFRGSCYVTLCRLVKRGLVEMKQQGGEKTFAWKKNPDVAGTTPGSL